MGLQRSGWIVTCDHEPCTATVHWSEDLGGLQDYLTSVGWTFTDDSDPARWRTWCPFGGQGG
jgi:hypothetical protein